MGKRVETPEGGAGGWPGADGALARADDGSLEAAYQAWHVAGLEHAAFRAEVAAERGRLDRQGALMVGAVRAAGRAAEEPPGPAQGACGDALVQGAGLQGLLAEAEAKLEAARGELDERSRARAERLEARLHEARQEVVARVRRFAEVARPRLALTLRQVFGGRAILHAARLGPEEAVLLLHAFTGKLPSRYNFVLDDSTDDAQKPLPTLYPEEGVSPSATRPDAPALRSLLEAEGDVLPAKAHLPLRIPTAGGRLLGRFVQRGPVLELELEEGAGFRSLLTTSEAEEVTGYLLRLKLEGRLELEICAE